MNVYEICKLLIGIGRTADLQDKVNMFYACGQMTEVCGTDQYADTY